MKAADILTEAARLVSTDRAEQHGDKHQNMALIARFWNVYLQGRQIGPEDVPVMMALLKVARIRTGALNPDNFIDACGYLGIAAEVGRHDG